MELYGRKEESPDTKARKERRSLLAKEGRTERKVVAVGLCIRVQGQSQRRGEWTSSLVTTWRDSVTMEGIATARHRVVQRAVAADSSADAAGGGNDAGDGRIASSAAVLATSSDRMDRLPHAQRTRCATGLAGLYDADSTLAVVVEETGRGVPFQKLKKLLFAGTSAALRTLEEAAVSLTA